MPSTTGFGLGDSPFTSDIFGSFDELSRSVAASNSSATSVGGASGGTNNTSSGGGFFDSFLGAIGNTVSRVADFGTQLFFYDELAERGQVSTNNTTTTTNGTGSSSAGTRSGTQSLINGVSNQTLMIGFGVVVVLLLLFVKVK